MSRTRPTLTLVGVFVVVFLLEVLGSAVGFGPAAFALSLPLTRRPWTLVTSVYAHAGVWHLLANSVALLVVGLVLERRTSAIRFYLFFLVTGMLAGVAQVTVAAALGHHVAVLGSSGGIFALLGYLLAGNRVTDVAVAGIEPDPRIAAAVVVAVAVLVTLLTAGSGVALFAHFTGLVLGLVAGRGHVLRTR
ncbi:MAG: rhomboid family intramembrane serine protease [Haloarculaceae archaeon]